MSAEKSFASARQWRRQAGVAKKFSMRHACHDRIRQKCLAVALEAASLLENALAIMRQAATRGSFETRTQFRKAWQSANMVSPTDGSAFCRSSAESVGGDCRALRRGDSSASIRAGGLAAGRSRYCHRARSSCAPRSAHCTPILRRIRQQRGTTGQSPRHFRRRRRR